MPDPVDIRAIAKLLADLPAVSRDPLDLQARSFSRAIQGYDQAVRSAGIGSQASNEAHDTYRLSATLYSPTLIAALARAVLERSGA